jgi:hypothetical protein
MHEPPETLPAAAFIYRRDREKWQSAIAQAANKQQMDSKRTIAGAGEGSRTLVISLGS